MARGEGSIVQRKGTANLYIRYYVDGKDGKRTQKQEPVTEWVREHGGDPTDPATANKMLRSRIVDTERGATAPADVNQLRYEDIRDAYLRENPEQEDYPGMKHLDSFFKGRKIARITTDTLRDFIEHRRDEDDAAGPTIRRNLVALRAMFNLARKEAKLGMRDVPYFPMPEDSEPAGQYIEPKQFEMVLAALPENLKPFFSFMYGTGCRLGALRQITWDMVNASCDVLNLPGSITKTKKPLLIVLDGPMLEPVVVILRKRFRRDGQPVFDSTNYRPEWAKAVAKAGLGTWDAKTRTRTGVRIHDCRCSAAINLLDAGVDEGTVLKIGGWKTRAMLDRYNVQNEKRIRKAMKQGGEFVAAQIGGQA